MALDDGLESFTSDENSPPKFVTRPEIKGTFLGARKPAGTFAGTHSEGQMKKLEERQRAR